MALERVQKIMSNAGYCSRRKAEELIADGKVMVNSVKIKLGDKADLSKDTIMVSGKPLVIEQRKYYAFYKPDHILTTLHDPFGKPTIADYLTALPVRVFPVGRLDFDAEGLLILTNDGDFANRMMYPRYETSKTYQAELRDRIRDSDFAKLRGIVHLDDGDVKIESAKRINESTIEITIHEGRHKIVKRIFKDLGFYVKRLKRTQVGMIRLDKMKSGEIKEIPEYVIKEIMNDKKLASGDAKDKIVRKSSFSKDKEKKKSINFSKDNDKKNSINFSKDNDQRKTTKTNHSRESKNPNKNNRR